MGQCACHPEIETQFLYMKHNRYLCEECLKCHDPELYCKFRSSCPIWFLEKRGGKELLDGDVAAAEGCKPGKRHFYRIRPPLTLSGRII